MTDKTKKIIKIILGLVTIVIFGIITVVLIDRFNKYPMGSDVYGHIFKITKLNEALRAGDFFLKYSPDWYSGFEIFRYWPAGSYYFYQLFMIGTNDAISAFLPFTLAVYIIGAIGIFLFGVREDRIALGTLLGILWFYFPDNIRVFFGEGNIPRIFINSLIPYVFFFISEFLYYKKKYALICLNLLLTVIVTSHIMIAAMVGISLFIYLFIDAVCRKCYKDQILTLVDAVLGYINAGIILLPGVTGGLLSQGSSAAKNTSSDWVAPLYESFNPVSRFIRLDNFYFGITVIVIIVLGLMVSHKETIPAFTASLIIFLCTSVTASYFISMLPFSQVFWMTRFVPIAMAFFSIGFIKWKTLRKYLVYVFSVLIVLDCATSFFQLGYVEKPLYERYDNIKEDHLLDEAFDICQNKVALMDLSELSAYPSYYCITRGEHNYLFGWAYQGAVNIEEIVDLNESFEKGCYTYMFDRLTEYGADSVVIKKSCTDKVEDYRNRLIEEGAALNYSLVDETDSAMLFKLSLPEEVTGRYGTINEYKYAAIGASSNYMCYMYPCFYKLKNDYIDDYDYDYLRSFNSIYMSGFRYRNIDKAEEIVRRLARDGVKIYMDVHTIPFNEPRGRSSFLGVYAQVISFTESFPILTRDNGSEFKLKSDLYGGDESWKTSYITGAYRNLKSSVYEDEKILTYLAEDETGNIKYIGLNLLYYYFENRNTDLGYFLDDIFYEENGVLIDRTIKPVSIDFSPDYVIIKSDEEGVNVNMCVTDNMINENNSDYSVFNNVIVTGKDDIIRIRFKYAHFVSSLILSILGYILTILFFVLIFRKYEDIKF